MGFAISIGAILSQGIPNPEKYGLDFAIIAVFVALIPGFWRCSCDFLPWSVVVISVVLFGNMFPEEASRGLIFGALLCAATSGFSYGH